LLINIQQIFNWSFTKVSYADIGQGNQGCSMHTNIAFPDKLTHLDPQTRLLVRSILSFSEFFLKVDNETVLKTTPDPVIFVFNHNNYWETLVVGSYLLSQRTGKKLAFLSDWMFGRLPIFSWFLKRIDPIYTYRKRPRFAVLNKYQQKADGEAVCQACLQRLHNSQSLGIFPEGARNKNPHQLKRGRKGVGEIALRSGVPVLPVGIAFSPRPDNGHVPFFSPITLKFGSPLTFPEEGAAYGRLAQEAPLLSPLERKKLRLFLSARVTHSIMLELARLSGKIYPFPPPQSSSLIQQYFGSTLREGETHDHRAQSAG
jgi:1-acyl-sn-glycerol-3-phosphate acyltransferase